MCILLNVEKGINYRVLLRHTGVCRDSGPNCLNFNGDNEPINTFSFIKICYFYFIFWHFRRFGFLSNHWVSRIRLQEDYFSIYISLTATVSSLNLLSFYSLFLIYENMRTFYFGNRICIYNI